MYIALLLGQTKTYICFHLFKRFDYSKIESMLEMQDPNKRKEHFFDRNPEFWDRVVKGLFISGLLIVFSILVLKWLGYFG